MANKSAAAAAKPSRTNVTPAASSGAKPKPAASKPSGSAAASTSGDKPKKEKLKQADGVTQKYLLKDGAEIEAVWQSGNLCCGTCSRRLPTSTKNDAQKAAKAGERVNKIAAKGQEYFVHFKEMLAKQHKKAGLPEPTDQDVMKAMITGKAVGDDSEEE